jgi:hypothetical protein
MPVLKLHEITHSVRFHSATAVPLRSPTWRMLPSNSNYEKDRAKMDSVHQGATVWRGCFQLGSIYKGLLIQSWVWKGHKIREQTAKSNNPPLQIYEYLIRTWPMKARSPYEIYAHDFESIKVLSAEALFLSISARNLIRASSQEAE